MYCSPVVIVSKYPIKFTESASAGTHSLHTFHSIIAVTLDPCHQGPYLLKKIKDIEGILTAT